VRQTGKGRQGCARAAGDGMSVKDLHTIAPARADLCQRLTELNWPDVRGYASRFATVQQVAGQRANAVTGLGRDSLAPQNENPARAAPQGSKGGVSGTLMGVPPELFLL
jgi:hypothetical protein